MLCDLLSELWPRGWQGSIPTFIICGWSLSPRASAWRIESILLAWWCKLTHSLFQLKNPPAVKMMDDDERQTKNTLSRVNSSTFIKFEYFCIELLNRTWVICKKTEYRNSKTKNTEWSNENSVWKTSNILTLTTKSSSVSFLNLKESLSKIYTTFCKWTNKGLEIKYYHTCANLVT